ncbi:TIGR02594 family protein [Bradyrhizobium sp. 179]|uniref:TIGR02594 family protein n=1 Tax=Bradyrhizobium sp. 179 TaxID=2782648 RepID=UPI001FF7FB65|nr:TIGR02594 family protein [Bradyrhizobium sp. 179]MCK1543423.1 TIGR02594 family protein [Bradyrhizobium sp. 179]
MLPAAYAWLVNEPGPKMLIEMLKIYGTLETPGSRDNPTILAWAKEIGVEKDYVHDSIPWCGLAMGVVAKRAGKEFPKTPLWALSWAEFGTKQPHPMLGDVLVFKRDGGGHVTLYVGEDESAYHCIGGNQSDQVNVTRIGKSRLYAARRAPMTVPPANLRVVHLSGSGKLSTNEA